MMTEAVIGLGIIALFFAILLAWASKRFKVEVHPMLEKIRGALPGVNCGACGYPNCDSFADALYHKKADVDGCKFGGKATEEKLCAVLGVDDAFASKREVKKAHLVCMGGSKAKDKFEYKGIKKCKSAVLVGGGQKECEYGCLGFGDCVLVCPVDAIHMDKKTKLPVIDSNKCIACEKCVIECPKNVIEMKEVGKALVMCRSHDSAKDIVKECDVGCISCGACVRVCPVGAIKIENNLAVIDGKKCIACGKCVQVCPRKVITLDKITKKQ